MMHDRDAVPGTLDGVLDRVWSLLEDGAANRHSAFHTPTIATTGDDGFPRSRTVILREAHRDENRLRFNTDLRAPKYAQMQVNPDIALHVYDAIQKTQVRVTGSVTLSAGDARSRSVWDAMQNMSRECYRLGCAPGSQMGDPAGVPRDTLDNAEAYANFAVADVAVKTIDWLYLRHDGHMRAGFDIMAKTAEWRAP